MTKLYFAYGANTNREGMALRCPDAEPLGGASVAGYRLAFRRVADMDACAGGEQPGVLWSISARCEAALDRYEGYPNLYVKREVAVEVPGAATRTAMTYVLRVKVALEVPANHYLRILLDGYRDFDLPLGSIERALRRAREAEAREAGDEFEDEVPGEKRR